MTKVLSSDPTQSFLVNRKILHLFILMILRESESNQMHNLESKQFPLHFSLVSKEISIKKNSKLKKNLQNKEEHSKTKGQIHQLIRDDPLLALSNRKKGGKLEERKLKTSSAEKENFKSAKNPNSGIFQNKSKQEEKMKKEISKKNSKERSHQESKKNYHRREKLNRN